MFLKLGHWLGLICCCQAFNLDASATTSTAAPLTYSKIESWLDLPTRHLPQIVLMLHTRHIHQHTANPYIQWFLKNHHLPLTLLTFNESVLSINVAHAVARNQRNSYAITARVEHITSISKVFQQRTGCFFYVLHQPPNVTELGDVFHRMWQAKKVLNNFMLTPAGVYIYDPFFYDVEKQRYGKIALFDGNRTMERQIFKSMEGYPLRVQLFRSVYARPIISETTKRITRAEGVDGKVATLLQERMNFSMEFQEPDPNYFGERSQNGTYNGVIGSIIKGNVDICLTGFFVKDYMVPELQFSVAVYDDQLCIYVPKAQRVPQSILPIYSVSNDLWLGFIMAAFLCATIWCLLRQLNLWLHLPHKATKSVQKSRKAQFVRIYIDTWVVWVRSNIVKYPSYHAERIFIASLCLVSVIFGAIFDSSLATVYIHPLYYKDINTLHELDESGLKIIYKYSSMADDLFYNETSPLFANLNKKLTYLQNLNADVTMDIAENRGKASVSRYTSLRLESLHFVKSKKIWVVPECPKYYTISYVMPKDSPWEATINTLLLRFLDAGLFVKWIRDMQTEVDIRIGTNSMFQKGGANSFKILTIHDLQLAFYIILLGNSLAGLCFLMEKFLDWFVPVIRKYCQQTAKCKYNKKKIKF